MSKSPYISLNKNMSFKGATRLYFTHYTSVVIIFLNGFNYIITKTTDEYRQVTDEYRRLQTNHSRVQISHRRLQASHKQLQTSHRRLHTHHSESFLEYVYKILFSERIWFSKCSYEKVIFTQRRKSRI